MSQKTTKSGSVCPAISLGFLCYLLGPLFVLRYHVFVFYLLIDLSG